jgi:competence protein ComEC
MYINLNDDSGVSPVIGVVLIVAVTVAIVSLVTLVAFDIGGDTSSSLDPTPVDVQYESESAINVQILSEPENNVIVQSALGTEYQLSEAGDSVTILNQEGGQTPVALSQNNGERSVLRKIPPKSFKPDIVVNEGESVQTALDSAQDGDIIVLERATYQESLNIDENNITLVGETGTVIDSPTGTAVDVTGANVQISNLQINGNGGSSTGVNGRSDTTLVRSAIENTGSRISGGVQEIDNEQFVSNNSAESSTVEIPELSATWINVGQADSILIQSETGDNMLIDTGDYSDDGQRVLNYLDKEGVNEIDHLVASHQDADHIGGHEAVIQEFGSSGIGNVYDNGVPRSTDTANEYVDAVSNNDLSITEVEQGDTIPFEGATVEVLNPKNTGDSGGSGSDNDMVVLKVTHGDNAMFFGGDVEADTGSESRIVNANQELDVEVMDVPHHGSSTSSSNTLLDALSPEVAVVSAPYDSQFGHPEDEVINRYENRNVDLFWTAANGNVTVTSDGTSITTSAEKGEVNDVTKDSNYEISVQSTDSSVEQGSDANIQIQLTNNGNVPDIQDIEMDVLGKSNPVDQKDNVKLTESESTSISLSWDTTGSEAKDYTVTVSSEDDTISRDISVTGGTGGSNNPTSDTLQNPSFESTGGWDFSDTDVQRSSSSAPSFDGNFSASMKDLTQSYGGRILESNPINVTGGEYYSAEIYYNIQSPNGARDSNLDEYSVEIVWLDSSGGEISSKSVFGDFSNSGGTWKEESFSGQAPSNAESAKLRIRAREGSTNDPTVYWDSASLTEFSNQLSNPSFESSGGWDFSDTDVQRSSSSAPSFDGSFSASMKDLTQGYDGRILESDPISVNAGERYQFGAYYNIQAPNGGRDSKLDEYSVKIVWFDGSGSEISDPGVFGDFPNSPSDWNEVSSTEIAPPSAESAKLRIRAKEGGTNDPNVYWDSAFIKT